MYSKPPWKVSSYQDGVTCVRDSHNQVLCKLVVGNDDNATLMAATPEMYEALKETKKLAEAIEKCSLEPDKVYIHAGRIKQLAKIILDKYLFNANL